MPMTDNAMTDDALKQKALDLGPWHHRIRLREGVYTAEQEAMDKWGSKPVLIDPMAAFKHQVAEVFPDGLQGRSFLDCACNCGGFSFAAKDNGAGRVLGFDVRDHWIDQAKFLVENREADNSDMDFRIADLLTIGDLGEDFDVTWFSGIFYHLPDPIASLKLMADRTKEILLLNTAVDCIEPGEQEDPGMRLKLEGVNEVMSGVHQLSWMPSGPVVLERVLNWLGFPETRRVMWVQRTSERTSGGKARMLKFGRVSIVAAREKGRLDGVRHITSPQP